jgi:hypothetical protein
MRIALGALLFALASLGPAKAAQYSTIDAAEIERLLGGTEQEKAVATFYLGGALDALSMTNTMMAEQGAPLYCPSADEDLQPSTVAPKLLEHIAELRRKPRARDALQQLTTSTILLVLLTIDYPCELGDGEGLLPSP